MTAGEAEVLGALFDSAAYLSDQIKSIGGAQADDGGLADLYVLMADGQSWRIRAEPYERVSDDGTT